MSVTSWPAFASIPPTTEPIAPAPMIPIRLNIAVPSRTGRHGSRIGERTGHDWSSEAGAVTPADEAREVAAGGHHREGHRCGLAGISSGDDELEGGRVGGQRHGLAGRDPLAVRGD